MDPLDVIMIMASDEWCNEATIKDLEQSYQTGKVVNGIIFEPAEANEQPCSCNTDRF